MTKMQSSFSRRVASKIANPARSGSKRKGCKPAISISVFLVAWVYISLLQEISPSLVTRDLGLTNRYEFSNPERPRRLGILVGIFTADLPNDHEYRSRHRKLMTLWNDPRVCTLADFEKRSASNREECELIYTFVVSANPEGSTEWIEADAIDDGRYPDNPIVVQPGRHFAWSANGNDLAKSDVTRLNIR
jgi:hypothetical protein